MSHHKHVLLVTLLVIDAVALAALAVTGGMMLWLIYKQPARWKALSDRLDSFLIGTGLFPVSVVRSLHRYDKFDRYFVWLGLIGCVLGFCIFIFRFLPLLR